MLGFVPADAMSTLGCASLFLKKGIISVDTSTEYCI